MSRTNRRQSNSAGQRPELVRCAIYTRKSNDDGLDMDFNSLDAQRESAEAYIKSQAGEGWTCLPEKYDDGGFTGGNMDRPALKRLLADIEAGKVDCVVVYKVDRLSRSLMDFARMMEVFDRGATSFVSVTQHFNTTHSMGRLTLNILLSFAQFEREIIGERIRDKIAAQRRRGKWAGGRPVLGYDVDRSGPSPKLVVNSVEAPRVRQIFALYMKHGSLLPVVKELRQLGWANKVWCSRRGNPKGGQAFDKCSLHALLTNPLYAGRIRHKDVTYAGEHEALVDDETWNSVQHRLKHNGRAGGKDVRNRHGALLRGLLQCKTCGRAMVHTFTDKRGRCYRYYTCTRAIKDGYDRCAAPSLPAAEIERVVIDHIRGISQDKRLLTEVLRQAEQSVLAGREGLATERRQCESELRRCEAEIRRLSTGQTKREAVDRLAELQERVRVVEGRLRELRTDVNLPPFEAAAAASLFADFDAVWGELIPRERADLVRLLVTRVEYDGANSSVAVSFHHAGIASLNGKRSQA